MATLTRLSTCKNRKMKRIIDYPEEFQQEICRSQIVSFTVEFFSDCFMDLSQRLKAVHVHLLNPYQRPAISHYIRSWEEIPQEGSEKWVNYQLKVDKYLRQFIHELQSNYRAIEGPLM
ncbi:MAG: hypothetical protein GF308_14835 [Candidatus Heimdallarchaeota archaeon]|nr:hypothetical protein [Candidatus Heimdallarchaeota archaeon]